MTELSERSSGWRALWSYPILCLLLGLLLGWTPRLLHGPIPEKLNAYYIRGDLAVWGFYSARFLVGFLVGISAWPRQWYLRGPLVGFLTLLPITFLSLAVPTCGPPCMGLNLATGSALGLLVAGLAWAITGQHHLYDRKG